MKLIKFLPIIIASLLLSGLGCSNDDDPQPQPQCLDGDGNIVTQTIQLPTDISGFNMFIVADVVLTKGEPQEVRITAEQNIIDNIETNVSNGIWDIKYDECVDDHRDITIYITMATLEKLTVTGVGEISSTNTFDQLNDLELVFTGAGSIDLDIAARHVNSNLTGAGNIALAGSTESQEITISGTGHYRAFDLISDTCTVLLTGVGNCEVLVNDVLDVTITGVGNVSYKGGPDITATITGLGRLINAN